MDGKKIHILILLLILMVPVSKSESLNEFSFKNYNKFDGLSSNRINCFYQDHDNLIWIGTEEGLSLFDGYEFISYQPSASDIDFSGPSISIIVNHPYINGFWVANSYNLAYYDKTCDQFFQAKLNNHRIESVFVDKDSVTWVCTDQGLFYQDGFKKDFQAFKYDSTTKHIYDIKQDNSGNLWIIDTDKVLKINTATKEVTIVHKNIYFSKLFIDKQDRVWVGGFRSGLFLIKDSDGGKVLHFNGQHKTFNSMFFQDIIQANDSIFYISIRDNGLYQLNINNWVSKRLTHKPNTESGLITNALTCLFMDLHSNLWIGTYDKGIIFHDKWRKPFKSVKINSKFESDISNNVRAIYQDSDNRIWIGTKEGGCLNEYHPDSRSFTHYCHDPDNPNSISGDYIFSIHDAKPGYLWVGTYLNGFDLFNKNTGQFVNYWYEEENDLGSNSIYALETDNNNNLFVGTVGYGLNFLKKDQYKFQHFSCDDHSSNHLVDNSIRSLLLVNDSLLYIGTLEGLSIYNLNNLTFKNYAKDPNSDLPLNSYRINCLFQDSKGNIWLGTYNGISIFEPDNGKLFSFNQDDGLCNNIVMGIMEDDDNNLWITTRNGLSKFSPPDTVDVEYLNQNENHGLFTNYYYSDGLQGNDFERNAYCRLNTGQMIVGGANGLTFFYPEKIKPNPVIPKVLLTGLKISNKEIHVNDENELLNKHINHTRQLKLNYQQRNFSISYTAVNYSSTSKNKYKYILEGFDDEYNTVGSMRMAVYTNIPPGKYTFKVFAANNDGVWQPEPKILKIKITPPFLISNFAIALYICIFFFGLYLSKRMIVVREKLKNDVNLAKLSAKKEKEINDARLQLFTDISHELRTPLSLVSLPIRDIIKKGQEELPAYYQSKLSVASRNIELLENNINQILDLRKLDTGNTRLNLSETNIRELILQLIESFKLLLKEQKIKISLSGLEEDIFITIDDDKISKVINNLLSNAIKYSETGDSISLEISVQKAETGNDRLKIEVKDTGQGIPSDEIKKVFDRFYQVQKRSNKSVPGTGIGLAIAKRFVELHEGKIDVQSELDKGSSFTVIIPFGLKQKEISVVDDSTIASTDKSSLSPVLTLSDDPALKEMDKEANSSGKITILVIEDNADMRNYLVDSLRERYHVISAGNGLEGEEKAIKEIPDLIISDIMMPEKDGIELTSDLKNNAITSHIPIILLTAKTTIIDQLKGYSKGAIEYIIKPFNIDILILKISTLLEYRRAIHEQYKDLRRINKISELNISKHDIDFLTRCTEIIENNVLEKRFSIPDLCEEVGMSKTQLYLKLKAITNTSIGNFIKEIKMKKAEKMLIEERLSVSEVSYSLGFINRSHFAKGFNDYFGKNPSDYQKDKLA